jgi:hypothetical protein
VTSAFLNLIHSAGSNVVAVALTDFRSRGGTRLHAGSLDTIVLAIAVKMAPGYTLAFIHATVVLIGPGGGLCIDSRCHDL